MIMELKIHDLEQDMASLEAKQKKYKAKIDRLSRQSADSESQDLPQDESQQTEATEQQQFHQTIATLEQQVRSVF